MYQITIGFKKKVVLRQYCTTIHEARQLAAINVVKKKHWSQISYIH